MTMKDLKASDNKRKSSDDDSLEANVVDLDAFNCARGMETLSVDSDAEVEV